VTKADDLHPSNPQNFWRILFLSLEVLCGCSDVFFLFKSTGLIHLGVTSISFQAVLTCHDSSTFRSDWVGADFATQDLVLVFFKLRLGGFFKLGFGGFSFVVHGPSGRAFTPD